MYLAKLFLTKVSVVRAFSQKTGQQSEQICIFKFPEALPNQLFEEYLGDNPTLILLGLCGKTNK